MESPLEANPFHLPSSRPARGGLCMSINCPDNNETMARSPLYLSPSQRWPPSNGRGYGIVHHGLEAEYRFLNQELQ